MSTDDSCLVRHLSSYHPLEPEDRSLLRELEAGSTEVARKEPLWQEGDEARAFYVLHAGWAYSYHYLFDGTRQVLEVFMPGDLIGLRDFAFRKHRSGTVMLKAGTVCTCSLKALVGVFQGSPLLSSLFFAMASREQSLLVGRLVNLGRRSASERLANFVAELYVRLRRTNPELGQTMPLPVPQDVLGDALGLSAVHVSRTFSDLREKGLLYRDKYEVCVPDLERLVEYGGFEHEYLNWQIRDLVQEAVASRRAG